MQHSLYKSLLFSLVLLTSPGTLYGQQLASNLQPAASGNLSKSQVALLIKRFAGKPHKDFRDFCLSLYGSSNLILSPEQRSSIGNFAANQAMSGRDREVVFRVLGLYAQLKYGGEAIRSLESLVEIPTVHDANVLQHKNKHFREAASVLKKLAKTAGLKFRNIDDRVYEISFPWRQTKGKSVAFHAHVDVVPAQPKNWVLNGLQLDPFKLTRVGHKLYGRGAEDDKNAIIVALYAMRVIVEEQVRLFNNIRLLIDTTEETTGQAMPYYLKRNPMPDYNIALDGSYPVVIAEKGYGIVKATFPVVELRDLKRGEAAFISVSGGLAYNQIPAVSRATLKSKDAVLLNSDVNLFAADFVQKYGGNFTIQTAVEGDLVHITVVGESAHSSEPQSGVNPVARMMLFISKLAEARPIQDNHITQAAKYSVNNWGLGYLGQTMGIAYRHDFMGPLTASITKLSNAENQFEVGVNLRIPVGKKLAELEIEINTALSEWRQKNNADVTYMVEVKAPMLRDPSGLWLKALGAVASESLSLPRRFRSSAGATSIHNLPNGVQFGLSMPDEKYTGHMALEHKTVDQFLMDLQIVTEAMARIGQMQRLE